jgi:hypothetical protein
VVVIGSLGLGLIALGRLTGRGRLAVVGAGCAVAAMIVAPTAWATSALDRMYDGSPLDASAGPSGIFDLVAPGVAAASRERLEGVPGGGAAIGMGPPTPQQRDLLTYLETHRHGARYLVATQSVSLATLYIRETGMPVLLVGGFSGRAAYPTPSHFRELVVGGQVRYVLEPAPPQGVVTGTQPETARDSIAAWVRARCPRVPPVDIRAAVAEGDLYTCGVPVLSTLGSTSARAKVRFPAAVGRRGPESASDVGYTMGQDMGGYVP